MAGFDMLRVRAMKSSLRNAIWENGKEQGKEKEKEKEKEGKYAICVTK